MAGLIRVDCYYKITISGEERIATVQYLSPLQARITYWDGRGPLDHMDVPPARAEAQLLQRGYEPANWAAELLEDWAKQSAWKEGLQEATYLAYWHFFKSQDRADLCREMANMPDVEQALSLARQLKKRHFPDVRFHWPVLKVA